MKRLAFVCRCALLLSAFFSAAHPRRGADSAAARDAHDGGPKLLSPQQALASISVPEGFRVTLFASEPVVRQPIGLATDARGRLWVCENNTYSDRHINFDLSLFDRIVILEDTDHDGRCDKHTIFWDKAQKLTSVELGFGGVWALCPPKLFFIPDRNGDDVPDGPPQVVLDGWDDGVVRHNIANGLRWGPDGWLYGRHGIQATSLVGPPGALPSQRTPLNCCIWRYHPTRKIFEVVCRGTTNPWGMDWNERGELFFINTVIGHLWHAVPGAHYRRMYGEDDNPRLYELMEQTADHFHWDTVENWSDIRKIGVSPTTDQAGGGHAHAGLLIYQGDNWPDRYRGTLFTINLHGRRLNNDILERRGAAYVGRHSADFLKSSDPWFRGLELIAGADGGVYLADWSDTGECHGSDGVHRDSGRIYKIVYGDPSRPAVADVSRLADSALVALQLQKNDWLARQSRRILQERAVAGKLRQNVPAELEAIFTTDPDPIHKLRALWCLYVTGRASDAWLLTRLHHDDESVRAWTVRLLVDGKTASPEAVRAFIQMVSHDRSGLVLLYLASALQRPPASEHPSDAGAPSKSTVRRVEQLAGPSLVDRWALAEGLAARSEFANDRFLPRMIWYGIETAVAEEPTRAVALARSCSMSLVVRCIARRLTESLRQAPQPVDRLVALAGEPGHPDRSRAILTGMAEALRGWRKAPLPPAWSSTRKMLEPQADDKLKRLVRELSVVFGDGRALKDLVEIADSKTYDAPTRRDALRILVDSRSSSITPLLIRLLRDRDLGAAAAGGLAVYEDDAIPGFLLRNYTDFKDPVREAAIITLSSRPPWARLLLEAVASGKIPRNNVPSFQIRQMSFYSDAEVHRRVSELWPELKSMSVTKRKRIDQLKSALNHESLAAADRTSGRRKFVQTCATCHTLFGQGGKIGPDLTGAQRTSLDYLLQNIIDPSALVAPAYRLSTIALSDGRILNGLVIGDRSGPTLTVQTPTERLVINRSDIEAIRSSDLSLMPEGQLDALGEKEIRDLIGYLMSPQQVPLPPDGRQHEPSASR